MKMSVWSGRLEQSNFINKALMALLLVLGLALVANGMFRRNVVVHVSPPVVQHEYWASGMEGSDEYFKAMGTTLLTWVTNVTPRNVDYFHSQFLNYVETAKYGPMAVALAGDSTDVKGQGLSRVFFPEKVFVRNEGGVTEVTLIGREKWWLASTAAKDRQRAYVLGMRVVDYKPIIVSLETGKVSTDGESMEPAKDRG